MGPPFLPSNKLSVPSKIEDKLSVPSEAWKVLRCRVRYMSDGAVFGSKRFVEEVFEQNRDRFGKTRKDGARKPKGGSGWGELSVLRDLRLEVFG